jgi:hypothetical protein
MRQQYFAGLTLAGLATLFGCSSTAPAPYPDAISYCTAKAKAICEVSSTCGIDSTMCQTAQKALCDSEVRDATASGTRSYNSDNAKTCIDALNSAYANTTTVPYATLQDIDKKCAAVFIGKAAVNTTCTSDYDCTSGLICSPTAPGATTMVCAHPAGKNAGDYCSDPGSQCATDTYCAKQPNNLWLCVAAGMQGAVCSDGTPCVSSQRCYHGLCQPRLTSGVCTSDGDCTGTDPYCDAFASPPSCAPGQGFALGSFDCKGILAGSPNTLPDAGTGSPMDGGTPAEAGAGDAASD